MDQTLIDKMDDNVFDALLSRIDELECCDEMSRRTRVMLATELTEKVTEVVNAALADKLKSSRASQAAKTRWANKRQQEGAAAAAASSTPVNSPENSQPRRARKSAPSVAPSVANPPVAIATPPAAIPTAPTTAVPPPLPPMPTTGSPVAQPTFGVSS